jgi:hypothetical protein
VKHASPEQIKQIALRNLETLVIFMKEAKEHSIEVMLSTEDRESLSEHRATIKTLHELIKLVEDAPDMARKINLADSETGSASLGDLIPNSF